MKLDQPIQLRLSNKNHDELRELAWDNGMKFSSYYRHILVKHVKQNKSDEKR